MIASSHIASATRRRTAAAALAALLVTVSEDSSAARPKVTVTALRPSCANPGEVVTIAGRGLRRVRGITIAGMPARLVARGRTELQVEVPAAPEGLATLGVRSSRRRTRPPIATRAFRVGCARELAIVPDRARAVEATVDAAGGSVTATAADGSVLRLQIPSGALSAAQTIRLTPLTDVGGLPFSGGLAAAVQFEPDGLRFLRPATLQVIMPAGIDPTRLVGFRFDGTGHAWTVTPVTVEADAVVLRVDHFSGAGTASATAADFTAAIAPLVNELGPLTVNQMHELLDIQAGWLSMFPTFCDAPPGRPLCAQVGAKIVASVDAGLQALCADPIPVVDELAIREVTALQG